MIKEGWRLIGLLDMVVKFHRMEEWKHGAVDFDIGHLSQPSKASDIGGFFLSLQL